MKILLAEDDMNISTIMGITLEQIGNHQVLCVENGEQALHALKKQSFDLIILDGMMPILDGSETCKKIKNELLLQTPIIFLSAKSDPQSIKEFNSLGAVGFIEKPFDPNTICAQIDQILESKDDKLAC